MVLIKRIAALFIVIVAIYMLVMFLFVGNYKERLWLHRCNSIEKFTEQHESYPNIEIDLVYRESGYFDVTHDEPVTYGLPLDSIFAHPMCDGKMWLDIKNITALNVDSVLFELQHLLAQYKIDKSRLIIESSSWQELAILTNAGFYTSYYFPVGNPRKLNANQQKSALDNLQKVVDSAEICAISFPAWWYSDIKRTIKTDLDLLTWKHRSTQYEFFLMGGFRLLNDKQVKVVLLKSKGKYHR